MADTVGSRYLTDAGVQLESTAATLVDAITVVTAIKDNVVTIFLPKEVIPSGTSDVTLTIKIVDALNAPVPANEIHILNGTDDQEADRIAAALNSSNTQADGAVFDVYKFTNLSGINPSQVFSVTNGSGGANSGKKTITLVSTRKEGNEVVLTQTVGGTTILGTASKTLSGAVKSVPVIRGVLMTPRGIVPTLDLANGTGTADYLGTDKAGLSVSTHIRALDVNNKNCGDTLDNDLVGYELGRVEVGTLGFDLILNGFLNINE
jgi:hypothetical protein